MTLKRTVSALFIIVFISLSACAQKVLSYNERAISSIALYQVVPGRPESPMYYELSVELSSSNKLSGCDELTLELPSKKHVPFVKTDDSYTLRLLKLPSTSELTIYCATAPFEGVNIVIPEPILRIQQ